MKRTELTDDDVHDLIIEVLRMTTQDRLGYRTIIENDGIIVTGDRIH